MIIKIGENISGVKVESAESCLPLLTDEIFEEFTKTAAGLKKVAPVADDFLFFSTVMMHAAEASAINDDGSPKLLKSGQPVKVGWKVDANGSWKWETNDPTIKPYKNANCFVAGTKILMSDGSVKNIEDIKIGDEVITHENRSRKVLEINSRMHNGDLYEIKSVGNPTLFVTEEHPFYVPFTNVNGKKTFNVKKVKGNFTKLNKKPEFTFIKTNELEKNNILLSPCVKDKIDSDLNPNIARLLGLFAAEGCYTRKYNKLQGLYFTFGIKEKSHAELVKNLFNEEFPDCSVIIKEVPLRSVINVSVTGNNIAEYFFYHTGEYSHLKTLSKEIVFGTDDVKKHFLMGYAEGDGCLDKSDNRLICITTSKNLAWQVRTMLNSLNIKSNIRFCQNAEHRKKISSNYGEYNCHPTYRIEIYGKSLKTLCDVPSVKYTFKNISCREQKTSFIEGYGTHTITNINKSNFNGMVYNFEVEEDHSYVANGVISHNCDIFPESELILAHKNWINKPLCIDHKSSSVDHVRGFIVDTYYDRNLKRIVALCALDKKNYPDLAHKVAVGITPSVSMGVGVSTAICFDCGKVAKVEHEFCNHMKTKTSYGEINVGLNPIELSIVVNPADTKAKIKHIIAAAENLNNYVKSKEDQLRKVAQPVFSASLNFSNYDEDNKNGNNSSFNISSNSLDSFINDLNKIIEKLKSESNKNEDSEDSEKDSSESNDGSTLGLALPSTEKLASMQDRDLESIASQLSLIKQSLDTLLDGEKMSVKKEGYYQGTEEPTPNEVKYDKDPKNEDLREKGDKQMDVEDMGGPDGMHPGVKSVGMSELERKKMLARASAEERALKRAAIVEAAKEALEKKSYIQGSGGVNEPTPGKTKYQPEKMNDDLKEDGDKQMEGKKPFPGVGDVNKPYGDDLKTKEKLSRAGLTAKFVKASTGEGSVDLNKTSWEVYNDGKLVLKASVNQLCGGRGEAFYDSIATEDFGKKLLSQVKTAGANQVAKIYKLAQEQPAPAPMPEAPADPMAMPPAEAPPAEGQAADTEDPKQKASRLSDEALNVVSDLSEAVKALNEEGQNLQAPVAEGGAELPKTASFEDKALQAMRKDLNSELKKELKECIAELNDNISELDQVKDLCSKRVVTASNRDLAFGLFDSSFDETKTTLAKAYSLMDAFVRYAKGVDALVKKAQEAGYESEEDYEDPLNLDMETPSLDERDSEGYDEDQHGLSDLLDTEVDEDGLGNDFLKDNDSELLESDEDMMDLDEPTDLDVENLGDESGEDEVDLSDVDVSEADVDMKADQLNKFKPGDKINVVASLNTKEGRMALRAKIAADTKMKTSPLLHDAHPKGSFTPKLDQKPGEKLDQFEDLEDQHDVMMKLVNAPVKVRKEAEIIHKLISEGSLSVDDLDELVARGADKETIAYYKKYYGQVDGGSEFATELLKDHAKASIDEQIAKEKVKLARAYDLAGEMVEKGLCDNSRKAIASKVDEIMKLDDNGFESYKSIIASSTGVKKTASRLPLVGETDIFSARNSNEDDMVAKLSAALSGTKRRLF